ncbi:MAG: PrsW family glutamic-type intramembrane protease [Patescibacteria group bacterium]|nr:PrsW family intramembrane metalloprotease [Patescibacteria group bacterium]
MDNQTLQIVISIVIALIPATIWLGFLFKKGEQGRKLLALIFLGGAFAVVPLWILDNLWNPETPKSILGLVQRFIENPQILETISAVLDKIWFFSVQFDIFSFLGNSIQDQHAYFIGIFIVVGVLEEIVKQMMLRKVDKKTLLIKTINDSIKFSFVAGLGFSFAENIKYFYQIWSAGGLQDLIVPYIFRSIFTAAAHMVFSGIFGYYYGIGKFSIDYTEQQKAMQKRSISTGILKRIFRVPGAEIFKEQMILKGLIIAIVMHAAFNFLLQLNIILPVIIFIVLSFAFLFWLLKRKAGQVDLVAGLASGAKSTMDKKDEDVVVELLGMWFNENKFVDVIHACERLIKKDPTNNVVKLFKAKALDKLDRNSSYRKVLNTVFSNERLNKMKDQSVISTKTPQKKQKDFKDTEEFKKFQEEEKVKRMKEGTFRLDI